MQLRSEDRSRGQVIIVAALVIAAIFVGLALVLNSGIYAENLSSRETTDTDGALSFTLATDETIAEAYERTNSANESDASGAETTFNDTMDSWESAQQRRGAMQGIGIDVEHTAHVGWRLEQDSNRNFTSNSRTVDWKPVDGASGVGAFAMEVTQSELYDPSTPNDVTNSFRVRVSNSSEDWDLYVFQNGTDVVVHSGDPATQSDMASLFGDDGTCRGGATSAVVNFTNESLAGANCDALNFSDDLNGSVSISFDNSESVEGTYNLVVNGSNAVDTTDFDDPNSGNPTAQAVVYSVSYASHYEKADMTYERRGTHAVREETYAS
ncbi:hypothetical protein HWV07_13190 [Natronomonas salina]|uniref:DUF7261 family protein n=1 Tax=Natronomonas salina TaxID=1710540 RepID=UPI0015B3EB65|nr:hypothetical protein [Natronomonas salina]QLD89931.1 hypothetical protein HWV07_13190 [Natronomonas salina]